MGIRTSFLNLRLFLEGQEVPVVSAEVTGRIDSPQLASIQIVATPMAHRIPPRTLVHLFVHDLYRHEESRSRVFYASSSSAEAVSRAEFAPATPETEADRIAREEAGRVSSAGETLPSLKIPEDMLRYRLLFWGEVLGITYSKTADSRAVILQCAGGSNYWDMVAADRRGGNLFGGSSRRAAYSGLTKAPFWDILGGDTGLVYEKLTEPPAMFPNLRGFTAGILHLYEELVGVHMRHTRSGTKITGANLFMAMAELRLRLLQQIGVTAGDDSPLRLLRRAGFGRIWRRSLRGLPRYFTFRELLKALGQYTFYGATSILCPHYTPPTGIYASYSGWSGFSTGALRSSPEWKWIPDLADSIIALCRTYLDGELADIDGASAQGQVVDPNRYATLKENLRRAAHRIIDNARAIHEGTTEDRERIVSYEYRATSSGVVSFDGEQRTFDPGQRVSADEFTYLQGLADHAVRSMNFVPVYANRPQALRRLGPVAREAQKIIRRAGELSLSVENSSLPSRPDPAVRRALEEIAQYASAIADYVMPPPGREDSDSDSEPAHLFADILHPDVWFAPPPRSNVIFPDHTVAAETSRNFVKEPTRLMVRMHDKILGSDPLFDRWWIAPVAPGLYGRRPVARSGGRSRVRRDILEHELMGGIVPMFYGMSDRDMYLGARIAGFGGRNRDPAGAEQKSYFQQVTNFLLFRSRFSARSMAVTSKFNPYLILGFPALVIDAPTNAADTAANQTMLSVAQEVLQRARVPDDAGSLILELVRGRTGVHHLGTITELSHMVTATGESSHTRCTLTYVREHNERIEYMGQDLVRIAQNAADRLRERTVRRHSARQRRLILEALAQARATQDAATYPPMRDQNYSASWVPPELAQVNAPPQNMTYETSADPDSFSPRPSAVDYYYGTARMIEGQPPENVTIIRPGRYKESIVFALDPPRVRVGVPPADRDPETTDTEDYLPGQLGPNGGEIVSAVDVTDEYRNKMTRRNVSGEDPAEIAVLTRAVELERERLAISRERAAIETWGGGACFAPLPGVNTDPEFIASQEEAIARNQAAIDRYRTGWLSEPLTLPFLGSPEDNRGRPITRITSDRVGVPVSVAEFPELVGIIGTDDPRATGSIILRVYRITEDMGNVLDEADYGAEDIMRPPWYSSYWLNRLVGGAVYIPLFGVGSIVDPVVVTTPSGVDFLTGSSSRETLGMVVTNLRGRVDRPSQEGSPVMSGILEGATIENAVDFIVHTYSLTRLAGYDVDAFIRSYTWRPIATMFDIFGSGDLVLDPDGKRVVSGVEGFHSRAFGPYSNLFGLVPMSDVSSLLGVSEDDVEAAARLDVRGRRWAIISAYRAELLRMRGAMLG